MREIKFRGKRVDNSEWAYGYVLKYVCACGSMFVIHKPPFDPDDSSCSYEVIPETVGQYTGLKDKNGVEIYEGDVLDDTDGGYFIVRHNEKTAQFVIDLYDVKGCSTESGFDEIGGGFDWIETLDFDDFHGTEHFKIIGNIHDNPELLVVK